MREDFFTPPQGERDGGKGGRRARRKTERKVKKLLRTEGRAERGKGWRGRVEEGGGGSAYAVRNADPFPRWPLWTISLPTAGPKNHNAPRLPPPPPSLGWLQEYTMLVVTEIPWTALILTTR